MRFSLRSTAFAILAVASVAANAAGVPQFYFSTKGGDNSRISEDIVTGAGWMQEYDVIVKNVGDADIVYNSGGVLITYANFTGASGATMVAGSDTVNVFNPTDTNAPILNNALNNSNITAWSSLFSGGLPCQVRGGDAASGTRPGGYMISLDVPLGSTRTLAAGASLNILTIKIKNNGFYGNGQPFKDIFLYTGRATATGGSTALHNGSTHFVPTNWENDSRLRLVPEPGTMLALAAGIGALAARRRRK